MIAAESFTRKRDIMYKVFIYKHNCLKPMTSITEALGIAHSENTVLSLTGGGGKTTTIRRITDELMRNQKKVIVTTTTHMREENSSWFCTSSKWSEICEVLETYGQVWAGTPSPGGKIASLPESLMEQVFRQNVPVLIEADGARMLPVKCPAEHEPVIRQETTHIINVYGMDAVGRPLKEVCFRPELAAELLGRTKEQMSDPVTEEDIARLALSPEAGRKCSLEHVHHTILLNKADVPNGMEKAVSVCRKIAELTGTQTKASSKELKILVTAKEIRSGGGIIL